MLLRWLKAFELSRSSYVYYLVMGTLSTLAGFWLLGSLPITMEQVMGVTIVPGSGTMGSVLISMGLLITMIAVSVVISTTLLMLVKPESKQVLR